MSLREDYTWDKIASPGKLNIMNVESNNMKENNTRERKKERMEEKPN
jgi:hypothetical protein